MSEKSNKKKGWKIAIWGEDYKTLPARYEVAVGGGVDARDKFLHDYIKDAFGITPTDDRAGEAWETALKHFGKPFHAFQASMRVVLKYVRKCAGDWIQEINYGHGGVDLAQMIEKEFGAGGLGDCAIEDATRRADCEALKDRVNEVLDTLTPREKSILQRRFDIDGQAQGDKGTINVMDRKYEKERGRRKEIKVDTGGDTHNAAGDGFDVTRDRIHQIEQHALRKLRYHSRTRYTKGHYEEYGA